MVCALVRGNTFFLVKNFFSFGTERVILYSFKL